MLAQDVVHDAFMALWRAPEAFDPARGAFRTFFLSLVHHRAVDTVRREERLRKRTERAANLEPRDRRRCMRRTSWMKRSSGSAAGRSARPSRRSPTAQRQVLEMAYFQA